MKYDFKELANLVQKAKDGDSKAFISLYEQTYKTTYFLALSMIKNNDTTQDAVQEVYTIVFANLHKLKENTTFMAWLNRITYTTCLIMCQKNKYVTLDIDEISSVADTNKDSDPFEMSVTNTKNEVLCNLINDLDTPLRVTIILKYYNNFKIKEIAKIMRCPEGTVKSRLNTSKKLLKNQIIGNKSNTMFLGSFSILPIKSAIDLYSQQHASVSALPFDFVAISAPVGVAAAGASVASASAVSSSAVPLQGLFSSVATSTASISTSIAIGGAVVTSMSVIPAVLPPQPVPPVLSPVVIERSAEGYVNKPVTVSLGIDGSKSLISKLYVSNNNGKIWGPTSVSDTEAKFVISENGEYTFYLENQSNQTTTNKVSIDYIDGKSPVLENYFVEGNVLTLEITDNLSGVDPSNTYIIGANGNKTLPFEHQGNIYKFEIDNSQPTLNLSLGDMSGHMSTYEIAVS